MSDNQKELHKRLSEKPGQTTAPEKYWNNPRAKGGNVPSRGTPLPEEEWKSDEQIAFERSLGQKPARTIDPTANTNIKKS